MTEEVKINPWPVLFIGGPKDGERVEMTALPHTTAIKIRNPNYNALLCENKTAIMFIDVTYRREAFRTAAGLYPVYVFEEIPQQDVMHVLLTGYRPAVETATKH